MSPSSSPSTPSSFRFGIHHSFSPRLIFFFLLLLFIAASSSSHALVPPVRTINANRSSLPPHAAVADFDATWRVFGPLLPATLAADPRSDPLALRPAAFFAALEKLERYPSQLAHGGYATWTTSKSKSLSSNRSLVRDQAKVRFDTIGNASDAAPFAAWVVGTLALEEPPVDTSKSTFVMVACSHAAYITPRVPISPQQPLRHHCRAGYVPCPLALSSQEYSVHMSINSYSTAVDDRFVRFGCNVIPEMRAPALVPFHAESIQSSIMLQPAGKPLLAGSHASIAVLNADEQEWATAGTISLSSVPPGIQLADLSPHPPRLAPGQMRSVRLDLDIAAVDTALLSAEKTLNVAIDLQYTVNAQIRHASYSFDLQVHTWPPAAYTASFLDNDGSVRAVSLRPPMQPCPGGGCALLLATNSAEVDASDDVYGAQEDAWGIMPISHGTSDAALKWLDEVREELPGVQEKLKPQYIIRRDWTIVSAFSANEVDRNEALDLVTHYPDLFVAVIPISRRYRPESERINRDGNGNIYSQQLSFADAGLRALFDSDTALDRYMYAENAVGVPIAAKAASPLDSNLGKFCSAVRGHEISHALNRSMVTFDQVFTGGKGRTLENHRASNLQPFLTKYLAADTKPALPPQFSFVTFNPAGTGSKGGLQILSLIVPFQRARFRVVRQEETTWIISTRNVKRMRFRAVNGVYPRPTTLIIDGAEAISVPRTIREYNGTSEAFLDVCAEHSDGDFKWELCAKKTSGTNSNGNSEKDIDVERSTETAGPLTQILGGRRVAVIYPAERKDLLALATRYANTLYGIGMAASVTADTAAVSLLEQGAHNVVVLGGSAENEAARALEKISTGTTVTTKGEAEAETEICIGTRCTRRKGTGIVYLTPGRFSTLGIVVAGTDGAGLRAAAAFLPVSLHQKLPEWVLVSSRTDIGIEAAGYWNNEWQFEQALSYPPYWTATAPRSNSLVQVHADAVMSRTRRRYALGVLGIAILALVGWLAARKFNYGYRWLKNNTTEPRNGGYERFAFMVDEMQHECES